MGDKQMTTATSGPRQSRARTLSYPDVIMLDNNGMRQCYTSQYDSESNCICNPFNFIGARYVFTFLACIGFMLMYAYKVSYPSHTYGLAMVLVSLLS